MSAELEETDSNASALTTGDPEPPKKQYCFKNPSFEVTLVAILTYQCTSICEKFCSLT